MELFGVPQIVVFFFLIFGVGVTVLWIWALVDALRVPDDSMYQQGSKLVWVLVIVLTGFIGAIIYLAIGRPKPGTAASTLAPPPPPPPPA